MSNSIDKFLETINAIRDADHGCIWNLKQTHGSLKRYLLEELYETLEAVDKVEEIERANNSYKKQLDINDQTKKAFGELKEELGDLLLQIVLHSKMAEEKGFFDFNDVVEMVDQKMIKRHPHVFKREETGIVSKVSDVDKHWDKEKAKEKANRESIFSGIPLELPALARAWKISKKAVKESFEWDEEAKLFDQLRSELDELNEVVEQSRKLSADPHQDSFANADLQDDAELELGDILFTVVNIARWYKIDPEDALRKTNNKFIQRFDKMMEIIKTNGQGKTMHDYRPDELEALWQEAKRSLQNC